MGKDGPTYIDFLAYALINLLGLVDVLDLARTHQYLRSTYVHQAQWPASLLLGTFKSFFMFVLLQQIFASLRQGKLLAETIADFWNPHEPIYEARNALPQYGSLVIEPLLASLCFVESLTREQRDQLPKILATIGPSTIPSLVRHLHDSRAHVRAIAIAALGHLHARETLPLLVALSQDSEEGVRQSVVDALGILGGPETQTAQQEERRRPALGVAEARDGMVGGEDGCRGVSCVRLDRTGRGDVAIRPGRRLVGRADARGSGPGSHRA